jgi:hypothetical protein
MSRDNPEHRIHTQAVAYLRRGFFARYGMNATQAPVFHCPNESDVPPQYRSKLARLGVSAGVPDLVIVHPTLPIEVPGILGGVAYLGAALEIKSPRGRLSDEQSAWLERWARAGFAVAWTRGHAATANRLAEWGYILPEHAEQWIHHATLTDQEAL